MRTEEPSTESTAEKTVVKPPRDTPNTHDTPPPKKRRSRPLLVSIVALIIAIMGGVATMAVYKAYFATQPTQPTQVGPTEPTITARSIVDGVSGRLRGTPMRATTYQNNIALDDDNNVLYTAPYHKVEGYNFANPPKVFYGVATRGEQAAADADYETIVDYLKAKGFAVDNSNKATEAGLDTTSIRYEEYAKSSVRCRVAESRTNTVISALGCADVASYRDNARVIQPLYTVLVTANTEYKEPGVRLGTPDIKTSSTQGYRTASLNTSNSQETVGGSVALLYQSPDKEWNYFINTQSVVECDKYNYPEVKKAYAGEKCSLPNGADSIVRVQ